MCGWFAISGHEFDLTVLAGVLSVMGFSINDTIVVFDRVRENFRGMRATPEEVLNRSVNQTLSRTIITSFVAFLTVLALYLFGGESLRGLAEAQIIGIVIGTLSSIFVACPLLLWLGVDQAGPDAEGEGRGGTGATAVAARSCKKKATQCVAFFVASYERLVAKPSARHRDLRAPRNAVSRSSRRIPTTRSSSATARPA